ncbi:amino acid permease [Pseudomonas lalucatii]|nr:amino acid permease [Pseudomonas lalucatii]
MLFMDQIALAASLGATSLFWWAYVLVLLFVPMALMTAELGTTYPGSGGVYHWCGWPSAPAGARACRGCIGSTTRCGCPRCISSSPPCSASSSCRI